MANKQNTSPKIAKRGLILAAPASGHGKTVITLALLRALQRNGIKVESAKVGPDYIDPRFHAAASGKPCTNFDLWAMGRDQVKALASTGDADLLLIEGVMGLFDGAATGEGSTADVAEALRLPVILIVNAASQSQSVAALIHGFSTWRQDVTIAGVIFNNVASPRHETMLREAVQNTMPVMGAIHRNAVLNLPSRHLGLQQAGEHAALDRFLNGAADHIERECDLDAIACSAKPVEEEPASAHALSPLGQRMAVAEDEAFAFTYPHLLQGWRDAGAEVSFFSPLANEAPNSHSDAIFLPGGYPELHAGKLASNQTFLSGLQNNNALIYGECGGFMVLGEHLIDAEGTAHKMSGLLPITTSFETPKRTLGYCKLTHDSPLPWPQKLHGHEFHYSTLIEQGNGAPLFNATNAKGEALLPMGIQNSNVIGSYAHVISAEPKS